MNVMLVDLPKQEISFVIHGEPASKANQRRLVLFGKRPAFIKSAKGLSYVQMFQAQCPKLPILFTTPVAVELHIWYASRRPDLDESLILDAMQGLIYANDRQVQERHTYWNLDRDRPRVAITVRPIQDRAGDLDPGRKRPGRKRPQAPRKRGKMA